MKKQLIFIPVFALLACCSSISKKADAYGNFEADEVTVSAETSGKILQVLIREGDAVKAGDTLAIIDTAALSLQKAQALAQKQSIETQTATVEAQSAVVGEQIANANRDAERLSRMLADGAATQKQLDDATGQVAVAEKQKKAYQTQLQSVRSQAETALAQSRVIDDRIRASVILAPADGVVLQQYVEQGELAVAGKAMFKMANLNRLTLRAYISGTQLAAVKIGQQVTVRIDDGKGLKEYQGTVQWIASEAEFTPKVIQTKEERVKLVYAVKIMVDNDGALKIGMPAEVVLNNE